MSGVRRWSSGESLNPITRIDGSFSSLATVDDRTKTTTIAYERGRQFLSESLSCECVISQLYNTAFVFVH